MVNARRWFPLAALVALAGCKTQPPPDPNDPAQVGLVQPDVLMRNLRWASEAIFTRAAKREISESRARVMLSQYAADLTKHIDVSKIQEDKAWEYAEVFRTARQWEQAKVCFELALKNPTSEDRRVNDTLRLAQVLANLGQVPEALKTARKALDAGPNDRGPLIPSLVFELAPAARGKGHDAELAQLIEEAIPIYESNQVEAGTEVGKEFLQAKPYLVREARRVISALRGGTGNPPNG